MEFQRDPGGHFYRAVEERMDPIMLLLSVLFIPLLLGPLMADLSDESLRAFTIGGAVVWLAFAFEYAILLYLAPDRLVMVRTHKLDLVIVLLPFLRPLAFLRVFRLATAASGLGRALTTLRRIGRRPGMQPFFLTTSVVIFAGAGFTLAFEHEQAGSTISNYGDALWWAFVTCTTVGYGDHAPVTEGGRLIAGVLMVVGIAGLGLLTASIAAAFVHDDDDQSDAEMRGQLDRMERQLDLLLGNAAEDRI